MSGGKKTEPKRPAEPAVTAPLVTAVDELIDVAKQQAKKKGS